MDGPCESNLKFTKLQDATMLRAARRRVSAAVRREAADSTRMALGHLADMPVYGAFVTLRRAGRLRSCCGHIEWSGPLCMALDCAADRAATDDPRFPRITPDELPLLDMDVWVLAAPQTVAAKGQDRLQSVIIGKHGVQIARGHARGLLLPSVAVEHGFDALTLLEQLCLKAGLPTDAWRGDDTKLRIFEGHEIRGRLTPNVPEVRQPAVAGGFYPGSPVEVERTVDALFANATTTSPEPWPGAMVPHAGWIYSGRLAAGVFSRIAFPEEVVIFCPRHRPHGDPWAVAPHRRWLFPGGELASDPDLSVRLSDAITGLTLDATSHCQEHAIEVQLPLLARVAPNTRVVGIAIGDGSLPELLRFGAELAFVLAERPRRPMLIVSSDMNHFADEAKTRQSDRLALDAIATLDPAHVYETVRKNRISMCGLAPCVIVLEALRQLGCLQRCETVGYATSADAGGPRDRVVGYAGLLFG